MENKFIGNNGVLVGEVDNLVHSSTLLYFDDGLFILSKCYCFSCGRI